MDRMRKNVAFLIIIFWIIVPTLDQYLDVSLQSDFSSLVQNQILMSMEVIVIVETEFNSDIGDLQTIRERPPSIWPYLKFQSEN